VSIQTSDGRSDMDELLRALGKVDSPTVANAIERYGVRDRCDGFVGGRVRCLFPEFGAMVGRALTVRARNRRGPIAPREGYWKMWEELERLGPPSVVVAQDASGEPSRCALFGEVMTRVAMRLGAVGMITDGGVRDVSEVRALGFAYFARYTVVSHGNFEIVDIGQPVSLDGQEIRTGDILHGDSNGIVIVPSEVVGSLAGAIEDVRASEARRIRVLADPQFSLARFREASQP